MAHPQSGWPGRVRGDAGSIQSVRASPKRARHLRLPTVAECREIMEEIRGRVLARLAIRRLRPVQSAAAQRVRLPDGAAARVPAQRDHSPDPAAQTGRPYSPVGRFDPPGTRTPARQSGRGTMVRFPGGLVEIGTDDRSAAYDNERPRHRVKLAPFWIDRYPVTNRSSPTSSPPAATPPGSTGPTRGWEWVTESGAQAPMYWSWS